MQLQLKNVGMIKEANVKIDGLTVIAGENDTGKSTVGKALYFSLYEKIISFNAGVEKLDKDSLVLKKFDFKDFFFFNLNDGEIHLQDSKEELFFLNKDEYHDNSNKYYKPIFIETPLILNLFTHFSKLDTIQNDIEYKVNNYPLVMRELYKQLKLELKVNDLENNYELLNNIKKLIKGEVYIRGDEIRFLKNDQEIDVNSLATGIKSFAIIQLLLKNNYLNKNTVLILDEPEVHLHPKWQLEYAKIIVELVKNSVKVLATSHSPYMIEALKRYSDIEKIEDKTNFYLAEDGYIKQEDNSNSKTLDKIFEKLSEPFETFEEMDAKKMENLING